MIPDGWKVERVPMESVGVIRLTKLNAHDELHLSSEPGLIYQFLDALLRQTESEAANV